MSEFLGRLVQDGDVKFWSPSALDKGNPDAFGGCERKFYYRYVEGLKEPERKGREAGVKAHAEIEHYIKTGEDVLGTVARRVRKFIPARGPDLLPEHEIPAGALTLEGRRVIGKVDLVSPRSVWITPRGELDGDPRGTVEVIDWKFVSNMAYAKSGHELLTLPMVTYGRWVMDHWRTDWMRVSHVYGHLSKNEPPAKTTLLPRRIDIERRWEHAGKVARSLLHVAKAASATEVSPNLRACEEYGGCAYYETCPRTRDQRLASIFGAPTPERTDDKMNLLANMNLPPTTQVAPAAPTDPAAAAAYLREQERQVAIAALPPNIVQNWACVKSAGMGNPPLGGIVARAVALIEGIDLRGDGLAGAGQIGSISVINTPELLHRLAEELATHVPTVNPKPYTAAVLPPDAPVSNPTATQVTGVQSTYTMGPPALATPPPNGIGTSPVVAPQSAPAPAPAAAPVAEAPKRTRGRPKKSGDLEAALNTLSKALVDAIMAGIAAAEATE